MLHLSRTMVVLKGLATPFWVNPRKMRWPHYLPYPVLMIMSFHSFHETHEMYDHIQLRMLSNLPSRWIDVQTVLSFLPCHHPLSSTFIILFAMSSSFAINIVFPSLLYMSWESWAYKVVHINLFQKIPTK